MCKRRDQRHVGAWLQFQMIVCLVVSTLDHVRRTRINNDELSSLTQPPLHLRREYWMCGHRIRADHHDHVRLHHGIKRLSTRRFSDGLLQPIARGRMTDTRTGIDVVITKCGAYQLLHQVGFLIRAAR